MKLRQYKKSLTTLTEEAFLDFSDYTITIKKFEEHEKIKIEESIGYTVKNTPQHIAEQIKIRSLIKHELTHFTDLTSTTWGIEYIIRKGLVINAIKDGESDRIKSALDVFMINASELEMHTALKRPDDISTLYFTKIEHSLDYSAEHGTFIWIIFKDNDSITCQTPLSMLSLIETHAFANETISQIIDAKNIEDPASRTRIEKYFLEVFEETLKNKSLTEYTSLIILAKHHHPELNSLELLKLVCAICKFSLDADGLTMSSLANQFEASIKNKVLGDNICHDMRRGASRHLIAFKTILFIYGWLHQFESEKTKRIELLKLQPQAAMFELWEALGVSILTQKPDDDWIFDASLQRALELNTIVDKIILSECSKLNRSALHAKSIGELNLAEIKAPNIFLQKKEPELEINLPNTTSLSAYLNFELAFDETWEFDKQYRSHPVKKFHMNPRETHMISERLRKPYTKYHN